LEALLVIEAVALKVPAALGLKTTLTGVLWPARIATGRLGALNEKYLVEIVALLTVMEAVPVFDTVMLSVLLVPTVTLPKSTLDPLRDKIPDCCVEADLLELNPWQPTIVARQRKTNPSLFALLHSTAAVDLKHFIVRFQLDSAKTFEIDSDIHTESAPGNEIRTGFKGT
jgi:hypothetical protein